jgi:hypothetical protein
VVSDLNMLLRLPNLLLFFFFLEEREFKAVANSKPFFDELISANSKQLSTSHNTNAI